MKHFYDVVSTIRNGLEIPAAGVSVTVNQQGTLTAATLYSDDGVTVKTNPAVTDASGRYDFYVANGRYDLVFTGAGFTGFTQFNVEITDAMDTTTLGKTSIAFTANNTHSGSEAFTGSLNIPSGATNPATCLQGAVFYNTTSNSVQSCTASNIWSAVGGNTVAPNWQRLGTVIGVPSTGSMKQETSCFVQTNPQVLTGFSQVVACLRTDDPSADNIYYAEAPSPVGPFTDSATNPVITGAACISNIINIGGNLVAFACNGRTDIHRWHSANNGITWVDDGLEIAHGGGGWKNGYVENPFFLLVGNTCHLWFEGATTLNPPLLIGQGHAIGNSTCAHGSFTEDAGNPVIPTSEFNGGGPYVYYDGTNFWQWEHGTPGGSSDAYPTNIYFTKLNANGSGTAPPHAHTKIFQARLADEGGNQTGENTQVADPMILEWPNAPGDPANSTYMFYTSCALNCAVPAGEQMSVKVAVIRTPQSSIVASSLAQTDTLPQEIAVPPIYSSITDYFGRANSPDPGQNWSQYSPNVATLKIVSNQLQPNSTTLAARQSFGGAYFPLSQYSQGVFVAAAATSAIGLSVRTGTTGTGVNSYECVTAGALGTSQSMVIRKLINSSVNATLATFTATPAANDVWQINAVGTNPVVVSCLQNGVVKGSGTDSSSPLAIGQPGIVLFDSASTANAIIKNWQGGPL